MYIQKRKEKGPFHLTDLNFSVAKLMGIPDSHEPGVSSSEDG